MPTSSRSSFTGSVTCAANAPKARTRTMPNSASRSVIGFWVPHFMSVKRRVLTKYTSALKGDWKPYFQPFSVDRIGMFFV